MNISKIEVKNYRLLKNFVIDLEDDLSLIIGRNNTGKTSLLTVIDSFINNSGKVFKFEDMSFDLQNQLIDLEGSDFTFESFADLFIELKFIINYTDEDDLGSVSKLIIDLDENSNNLILMYRYVLDYNGYVKLLKDYEVYKEERNGVRDFKDFLSLSINRYFKILIYAIDSSDKRNKKLIDYSDVEKILSFTTISAKRNVDNANGRSKNLSNLANKYYSKFSDFHMEYPLLDNALLDVDDSITEQYYQIFDKMIKSIKDLTSDDTANISIVSKLSDSNIFSDNTKVLYEHGEMNLPEDYNGLGYLNIFSIVMELVSKIEMLFGDDSELKTPLNLIFIEEPEAHTHPQLQYIFINNILDIVSSHTNDCQSVQTIITTHSAHILSQSNFEHVKYFIRFRDNSVLSKNLKSLMHNISSYALSWDESEVINAEENEEAREKNYRFLKQYLTINFAELFFTEKAILFEGDTERILLPIIMKKMDNERGNEYNTPLLSQNISLVEAGAYSHILSVFLDFIDVKTLIITDLDSGKINENGKLKKERVDESTHSSNASIKYYVNENDIYELKNKNIPISLSYNSTDKKWFNDEEGRLSIIYQTEQNNYHARSFEDAFISNNIEYIFDNKQNFLSLKNRSKIIMENPDYYDISENCINKKTDFALDIIYYSDESFGNWIIPDYLEKGIKWLAKDGINEN